MDYYFKKINMKTKIYWAPFFDEKENVDWSILYKQPEFLQKKIIKNINKTNLENNNLIYCPAVKNLTDRTFALKFPMDSHYQIKNQQIIYKSKNCIGAVKKHANNFTNNYLFVLNMSYAFFTEEDINMTLTAPYFSDSPHLKFGSIIPGKFNISKWFRNIDLEINLWTNKNELIIKENEDIAYVHFDTDKQIELVRFEMNTNLHKMLRACSTSSVWEKFVPFSKRYKRFKESLMNKKIIKEIKNSLI